MRAYQYFHLPSGYAAKTSDNNPNELQLVEAIRTSISTPVYFAYFYTNNVGVALNSRLDETKNQFIRGRLFALNEITTLPLIYAEGIPDMRLPRADAMLMVRPFMAQAFSFKPLIINKVEFAKAFDMLLSKKEFVISTNSNEEALLITKSLLNLLPLPLAQKISLIVSDTIIPFKNETTDGYGQKIQFNCQLVVLNRPMSEDEKNMYNHVDFVKPATKREELTAVGSMICNIDLNAPNELNELKKRFATFIDENGVNQYVLQAADVEDKFVKEQNVENLHALIDLLANLPNDQANEIIYRLANTFAQQLEEKTIAPEMVKEVAALKTTYPQFNEIVDRPYQKYISSNFLSLEGQAENEFAMTLAASREAFEEFFNDFVNEENQKKKAKRFSVLLYAILFGSPDYDFQKLFINRLMDEVNIMNRYQLLSHEEKNEGEAIFYGIDENGHFSEHDLDKLAFLVYSAYLKDTDDEWKKIRLKGLEKRLKDLPILEKLRVINDIKGRLELFATNNFYDHREYSLMSDLNNFYFDLHRDELRSELKKVDYREKLEFYDRVRSESFLSLLSILIESICDIRAFLTAYPDLSRSEVDRFLSLFSAMPQTQECLELVNYFNLCLKEAGMNETYMSFRKEFLKATYALLEQKDKNMLPAFPSDNDSNNNLANFSKDLATSLAHFKDGNQLINEIDAKVYPSEYDGKISVGPIPSTGPIQPGPGTAPIQTLVYVELKYKSNPAVPFEVKASFNCDKEVNIPAITFVAARRLNDPNCPVVNASITSPFKLKKGLFGGQAKGSLTFKCPPIEPNMQLFAIIEDRSSGISLQITRNTK